MSLRQKLEENMNAMKVPDKYRAWVRDALGACERDEPERADSFDGFENYLTFGVEVMEFDDQGHWECPVTLVGMIVSQARAWEEYK
jgi:hypothetical protein